MRLTRFMSHFSAVEGLNENNIEMAKITNLSPPARENEGVARGKERGSDDGIGTRFFARLTHFGNVGWQIVSSSCALRHQKQFYLDFV